MADVDRLIGFMAIMQVPFMNDPDALAYIEEVKTVLKQVKVQEPGWISVKERMPEENQNVLIYGYWTGASGKVYYETWLACMKEFVYQGNVPIAWQPLPEPPKEDESCSKS